jgi:hypothetical protein
MRRLIVIRRGPQATLPKFPYWYSLVKLVAMIRARVDSVRTSALMPFVQRSVDGRKPVVLARIRYRQVAQCR